MTDTSVVRSAEASRVAWRFLWTAAVVSAVVLAVANVILGNLNQDEGWYLLAAVNSADGGGIYRDFMFTQGAAMPEIYGFLLPVWYPFGVLGGRILTAIFGLAASVLTACLAFRLAPRKYGNFSAYLAFLLIALSPVHSYFTSIPKTYALASLFLMGGFLSLVSAQETRIHAINATAALSGLFLALATCVRISLGAAVAVVGIYLLTKVRDRTWRYAWISFGLAAAVPILIFIILPALRYPEQFMFAQSYHTARTVSGPVQWAVLRAGFLSRVVQAYPALSLLVAALCVLRLTTKRRLIDCAGERVAIVAFLAVSAVHALSPFPYDDYQTPVMPLLAAVSASAFWRFMSGFGIADSVAKRVPVLMLVCSEICALASPLLMDWVAIRQDRFWIEMKRKPDILLLKDASAEIRSQMPDGGTLFTQDAYLAVETRCAVPTGMEMGPFCIFPDLTDEEAVRQHVHTPSTMEALIASTDAKVCALSGYSFAVSCPSTERLSNDTRKRLFDAVSAKYEIQSVIRDFGQGHTILTIGKKRD